LTSVFSIFGKVLLLLIAVIAVSWCLAHIWSEHGDWWLRLLPDAVKKAIYSAISSFLSADVTEAEDQLAFCFFWIPSFVISVVLLLVGSWGRKELFSR